MITKERLEELIEQGSKVYCLEFNHIYSFDFEEYEGKIESATKCYPNDRLQIRWKKAPVGGVGPQWSEDIYLQNLFETEEDARWELEMTATRTETLKMPKWEEAQDEKFHFSYLIDVRGLHLYISIYNFTKQFEIYCNHGKHTYDYKFDRTFDLRDKEQYKTACKLCLRLFGGEEV